MDTIKVLKNVIVKKPYDPSTATLDLKKGIWISAYGDNSVSDRLNKVNPPIWSPADIVSSPAETILRYTLINHPDLIVVERIEIDYEIPWDNDRVY